MKYLIKYKQKLVEYLFGQLRTSFVNFGKTFVSTSFMSSTPACHSELVEELRSSRAAKIQRFKLQNSCSSFDIDNSVFEFLYHRKRIRKK